VELADLKEKAGSLLRGSRVCYSWLKEDMEAFLEDVIEMAEEEEGPAEEGWFVCHATKGIELVKYRQGDQNYDSQWMQFRAPTRVGALMSYRAYLCERLKGFRESVDRYELHLARVQEMIENE
jgi:hypothetical protein